MNIKPGTKLMAIDPCVMHDTGLPALIVGKIYNAYARDKEQIFVKSELFDDHKFPFDCIDEFFKLADDSINEDELLDLKFECHEWEHKGENFHEWIKQKDDIKISVSSNFRVSLEIEQNWKIVFWREFSNCRTITDLKHLIRILGI